MKYYIGNDNRPHCNICNEVLEQVLPNNLMGKDYTVPRMCLCERKRYEERRMEMNLKEKKIQLENNRSICFHEKRMINWTFENDNGKTQAMQKARIYVNHWQEAKEKGEGLLLWGGVGSGKTYMAACIANELLNQGKKVLMTDFVSITNISMYDIHEYVEALSKYELLIIDDLGAERKTEFAVQNIFDVINRRWETNKPLIITTNLSLEDIKNENDIAKGRIYDRILDMCTPLKVVGESKRIESSDKKRDFFKEIFTKEEKSYE